MRSDKYFCSLTATNACQHLGAGQECLCSHGDMSCEHATAFRPDTEDDYTYHVGNEQSLDIECLTDTIKVAAELALTFKRYCIEQNIPKSAIIAGVAWNGFAVKGAAYVAGKESQKDFFRNKLGL